MTQRSDQIVRATLELLAEMPVDRVTTRQIAARLHVSQPALFRHFTNRDAILEAAVDWTSGELERVAADVLCDAAPPLACAARLASALGEHAQRWPGLPRLLFADVAQGQQSGWSASLRALTARQRALVTDLVSQAVRRGEAPVEIDPERAGALFVAGMQGVLAQWLQRGAMGEPDVGGFAAAWCAGVAAGHPRTAAIRAQRDAEPLTAGVFIDGIALLQGGTDPLQSVLSAASRLAPGAHLRMSAPFLPGPLIALLRSRGLTVEVAPGADDTFTIDAWSQP